MSNSSKSYADNLRRNVNNAWNSALYGKWRKMVSDKLYNSDEGDSSSLIWILGCGYRVQNPSKQMKIRCPQFYSDYVSRIWITYRSNFPLIGEKDSDCGWGCMLRAAQMIVAHAITILKLGRSWRLKMSEENPEIKDIVRLFEDCDEAPLGLHSMIKTAIKNGFKNPVGQWYSPSQALVLLRDTINYSTHPALKRIKAIVAMDNCLAKNEVETLSENWTNAMIIFVCLRLGTKSINHSYVDQLRNVFTFETSLGIIGGRPKHAVYFVGFHDDKFYCLDPHTSQKYKDLNSVDLDDVSIWDSFHCHFEPSYMKINELDPSCAIGFLVKNANEFNDLLNDLSQNGLIEIPHLEKIPSRFSSKLFTVVERRPSFSSPALRKLSFEEDNDFEIL